jgi:hypothetical protein
MLRWARRRYDYNDTCYSLPSYPMHIASLLIATGYTSAIVIKMSFASRGPRVNERTHRRGNERHSRSKVVRWLCAPHERRRTCAYVQPLIDPCQRRTFREQRPVRAT